MGEVVEDYERHPIDGATGLPVLPEGYLWEVAREDHRYVDMCSRLFMTGHSSVEAYEVRIVELVPGSTTEKVTREPNPDYRWWKRNSTPAYIDVRTVIEEGKTRCVSRKRIVRYRAPWELDGPARAHLCRRASITERELKEWYEDRRHTLPTYAIELMDFTLNEGAILEAAHKALTQWNKLREEDRLAEIEAERVGKLVGLYPPKKLEEVSN